MKLYLNNIEGIEKITHNYINSLGDLDKYKIQGEDTISSIFLAGSPGAGKTEFLKTSFEEIKNTYVVIDIDIFRKSFSGYNGENSSEYQKSSVRIADKIMKFCFKNQLNFIFDGTFRNYNKVKQNFEQCEKNGRNTLIALVFQDPRISFYYTFLRKIKRERNVPIEVFIDGFYSSIENVFKAKHDFRDITILIAHKKYDFLNRQKFTHSVDYQTENIYAFCKKYRLLYKQGKFMNRDRLTLDIIAFNDTLTKQFSGTGGIWTRLRIWYIEKLFKL